MKVPPIFSVVLSLFAGSIAATQTSKKCFEFNRHRTGSKSRQITLAKNSIRKCPLPSIQAKIKLGSLSLVKLLNCMIYMV
jgi:hypothetical protein